MPIDAPFFPGEAFHQAMELGCSCRSVSGLDTISLQPRAGGEFNVEPKMIGFLDGDNCGQWLPGLYHQDLVPIAYDALKGKRLSLGKLAKGVAHLFVAPSCLNEEGLMAFTNLNTLELAAEAGFELL